MLRFRSALTKFIEGAGKSYEDVVGNELLDESVWQGIASKISNDDTRRKFLVEVNRWSEYYSDILKDTGLPEDFTSALCEAIDRVGKPIRVIARLSGVIESSITGWTSGRSQPTKYSHPSILKLEETLELPPGSLLSRLKRGRNRRFKAEDYPDVVIVNGELVRVRGNTIVLTSLRPLLPDDFNQRPMSEREEMVVWMIKNLIGPTTEWGAHNKKLSRHSFKLKFSDSLFEVCDLREASNLIIKLRTNGIPLSEYLLSLLPPKTRQLIEEYDDSGPVSESLQKKVVNDLNLLRRCCINNDERSPFPK